MEPTSIVLFVISLVVGGGAGYTYRKVVASKESENVEAKSKKIVEDARTEAKELVLSAKNESLELKETAKKEENERRNQIADLEKRLVSKEENLDKKSDNIDKKKEDIEKAKKETEEIKNGLRDIRVKQEENLAKIAKLTKEKALEKLLEMVERDYKKDVLEKIKKVEEDVKEQEDAKARDILAVAIQRATSDFVSESTVTSISIPNDEMKGRIIGREGRNIQAIEKLTGCDIIVDDTPETIVISGFDPVRRHICKRALEEMLKDGRINPSRIEDAVEKAKNEIDKEIKEAGEQAAFEANIPGLQLDLLKILGRLKFRTSYGQNVLKHTLEAVHIASALAAEIHADVKTAKLGALLHDVGKAIDREIEGTHSSISRDICKKFGMSEAVIHAVEAHHQDVPFKTPEAIIVYVADAISASRPGARRDSIENYIKRLTEIENIANSFTGVEKSFAIQAGREVRVLVQPEKLDDLASAKLAKKIAEKIEQDLKYPGQIKVNVIRETRTIEIAK
ncbi:ribonuclease Y [bacterium (Candidatus Howlettbacteria) CG_4_10_14_0_8_um_filter_40_9]|nr:MAG: ribonuclease Y [bacterium (Candidatus Howlettbacteria) CG_4_10_14_0_8_um_filter_40_9]